MANGKFASAWVNANVVTRYASALLALAVALIVGRTIGPLLGDYVPYTMTVLVLAFSGWYCGVGPSILATVMAVLGLKFWFVPATHSFQFVSVGQALGLAVLCGISTAIVAMGERRRRENESLRRAQGELEARVKERTGELDVANQGLRELTARLMQLQDDERRRIARELHDSVGQTLAALTMNLTTVGTDLERLGQTAKTVADSLALAQEMNKEVRTVSYLLHPPLLDETGLASALRWYVEGFSERSKIQVEMEIPDSFERLPQETETAIFRTAQECLTNIHRHSGSAVAAIRLTRSKDDVCLKVEDRGEGMPNEKLDEVASNGAPGVGIRGMRERLRQLGGELEIQSSERGTTVEARLPVGMRDQRASSQVAA
jgi:signal transduction histidine kinase